LAAPEEGKVRRRQPGWLVPPGDYRIQLQVGDEVSERTVTVTRDPRAACSEQDLLDQHELMLEVSELLERVTEAVARIKRIKGQGETWAKREGAGAPVQAAAKALVKALEGPEKQLTQPKFTHDTDRLKLPGGLDSKLQSIAPVVVGADAPVTTQIRTVFAKLAGESEAALAEFQAALDGPLAELNAAIAAAGIGAVDDSVPTLPS